MPSKYPWIPRKYYAAVMFACKMIRENGAFNRAISVAADYYDVDEDKLEKHVRARQAAGQKGKKRGKQGSLKWWVIPMFQNAPHESCWDIAPAVRRGRSAESVRRTLANAERTSVYSEWFYSYGDAIGPFDTEEQAQERAKEFCRELGVEFEE